MKEKGQAMKEKPILFYSTNRRAEPVTFREALLKGLAPGQGPVHAASASRR